MLISILITAFGFLASLVTIFCIFCQVKNPIKISKKDMGFIVLWLTLTILGIANLYYTRNYIDDNIDIRQSGNINETDVEEGTSNNEERNSEQELVDIDNTNLSDEELIKQNFNLIQELKAEYLDSDLITINNEKVSFRFYEQAAYVYQSINKTKEDCVFQGVRVTPTKMVVLDYFNDEIIYTFTPHKGDIEYIPGNENEFYCVIFHDKYDIFVTPPIRVVGGEDIENAEFCLNRKASEYTSLFQVRIHLQNFEPNNPYSILPDDYEIQFRFINTDTNEAPHISYVADIYNSGVLSCNTCIYFSLNTNYIMSFYIFDKSGEYLKCVAEEMFNGSVTNSNLVDIYFDMNNINSVQ